MKNPFSDILSKSEKNGEFREMLSMVINHMDISFILIDMDLNVLLFNQMAGKDMKELLGYELKEGTCILNYAPPERQESLNILYREVFNGIEKKSETEIVLKNGTTRFFENTFKPARNKNEEISGVIVLSRDITPEKIAELRLKETEERWRFALEGANQGAWDWNMLTNDIIYSNAYKKMYGFNDNELANRIEEWEERVHPEDKERIRQDIDNHVKSSNPLYESIYRLKDKNNEYKWILARGMLVGRDAVGRPLRMIGTHTDITERKNVEENYKLLFYSNPLPMWTYDLETLKIMDVNNAAIQHYGYTREEFLSFTIKDIRPEEDIKDLLTHMKKRNTDGFLKSISRHKKKNGQLISVEVITNILHKDNNNEVLVLANDITQKIRAEEALIRSHERFSYAAKATSEALWEWDILSGEVYMSQTYTDILGWKVDKHRKFDDWHIYIHPEDKKETIEDYYQTINDPERNHWSREYRYLKADGNYANVMDNAIVLRDSKGKAIKVIGAIKDITKQKKVELELKKSNERFLIAGRASSDALYEWDILKNDVYWGEGMQTLFGYHPKEITMEMWENHIHREDHIKVMESLRAALNLPVRQFWKAEYRFQKVDNTYCYVLDHGYIIRDEKGNPVQMIGSMQDITERKRLEQELLRSELEQQKAINQATIDTQEQERSEIGKELHDNVNQVLTTTKLYLDLALSNSELKDELIQKSSKNIINVINEIRQLSRSLMDPSIGDLGLMDSIQDLVENINLTRKLHVNLIVVKKIEDLLNKNQKLTVFRIIQEALNNAIKHARATIVNIHITQKDNDSAEIIIEDDGIGFLPDSVKKGVGLKNIQNRIYLINGTHAIHSSPDSGCRIVIKFPLK